MKEQNLNDLLDEIYLEGDNTEVDYWEPYSRIIVECLRIRDKKNITQVELAEKMKTRQSVISRFENMGRLPSYDFIARLSDSLGFSPGITLQGNYMAVVPLEKQEMVKSFAINKKMATQDYTQDLLERAIDREERKSLMSSVPVGTDNKKKSTNECREDSTICRTAFSLAV
jgi:transcriptional regulator with XRE-family HTH domain